MTHPIVYARNPDEVLYDADLGRYRMWKRSGRDQCSSPLQERDLRHSGIASETANGLRISLGRGVFVRRAGERCAARGRRRFNPHG